MTATAAVSAAQDRVHRDSDATARVAAAVLDGLARTPAALAELLDAIADTAERLTESTDCLIWRRDDARHLRQVARSCGAGRSAADRRQALSIAVDPEHPVSLAMLERRVIHLPDLSQATQPGGWDAGWAAKMWPLGYRAIAVAPCVHNDAVVGAVLVRRRQVAGPYTDHHIELLRAIADHAGAAVAQATAQLLASTSAPRPAEQPPRPQISAPPTVPLAPSFFAPASETTLVWLGASGFGINSHGTLLLLDPVITMHTERSGAGETGHRLLVPLPIEAAQVPRLDVVCYSHADADHFGRRTAQELVRTGALFVGPPPVAREFAALGIPDERQRVARIGQGFRVGAVDVTPIRADHPHQLLNPARREPPFGPDDCCGYLLRTPDGTIFFPGDTRLVWDHYQLQNVDVLLLDVSNCPYHLGTENAAKLANKLGAPHIIAYHFGTYDAPNSVPQNGDPADVAARIEDASCRFHVLAPGALFGVGGTGEP